MLTFQGLERVQTDEAGPGEIVLINGLTDIGIGVTITDPTNPAPLPMLTQNVSVTIGGLPAKVDYSGGAPQSIAGLTQINAEVPSGVASGPSVPVVVQIGTAQSQTGITMAVR